MWACQPHPHCPHCHRTFARDPGVKSVGALSGCAHSPSRSSRPFLPHHTARLLVGVTTRPAHAGHPRGRLLLLRLLMVDSHPHPHSPHVHGTFARDPGVKSFGLLLQSAHSPSSCSRPVSWQYTSKLCVAVGTLPAHAGHPWPLVRFLTTAPHLCPHTSFPHFHHTFSVDPRVTSCAPLLGSSHSSSRSSRPCAGHQSSRLSPRLGPFSEEATAPPHPGAAAAPPLRPRAAAARAPPTPAPAPPRRTPSPTPHRPQATVAPLRSRAAL
jgi:hypothetical protein